MGERRGLNDHPLRADCSTCRFAGTDGDMGQVLTCDAQAEHDDDIDPVIHRWVTGGEVGPCPAWQPGPFCDQRSADDFDDNMAEHYALAAVTR